MYLLVLREPPGNGNENGNGNVNADSKNFDFFKPSMEFCFYAEITS